MTLYKLWDSLGNVWYVRANFSHEAVNAVEEAYTDIKINMWEIAYGSVNASHQVWEVRQGKLEAV